MTSASSASVASMLRHDLSRDKSLWVFLVVCLLVCFLFVCFASWCFKPSQQQRIISGLRETFTKRYMAERPNKAEIRPEGQSEKAESCRENLWDIIQSKGPQRQK